MANQVTKRNKVVIGTMLGATALAGAVIGCYFAAKGCSAPIQPIKNYEIEFDSITQEHFIVQPEVVSAVQGQDVVINYELLADGTINIDEVSAQLHIYNDGGEQVYSLTPEFDNSSITIPADQIWNDVGKIVFTIKTSRHYIINTKENMEGVKQVKFTKSTYSEDVKGSYVLYDSYRLYDDSSYIEVNGERIDNQIEFVRSTPTSGAFTIKHDEIDARHSINFSLFVLALTSDSYTSITCNSDDHSAAWIEQNEFDTKTLKITYSLNPTYELKKDQDRNSIYVGIGEKMYFDQTRAGVWDYDTDQYDSPCISINVSNPELNIKRDTPIYVHIGSQEHHFKPSILLDGETQEHFDNPAYNILSDIQLQDLRVQFNLKNGYKLNDTDTSKTHVQMTWHGSTDNYVDVPFSFDPNNHNILVVDYRIFQFKATPKFKIFASAIEL